VAVLSVDRLSPMVLGLVFRWHRGFGLPLGVFPGVRGRFSSALDRVNLLYRNYKAFWLFLVNGKLKYHTCNTFMKVLR